MTATAASIASIADGMRERASSRRRTRMIVDVVAPIGFFLLLGAIWQWVAFGNRSLIPPIGSILEEIVSRPDFYLAQWWETVQTAVIGLVIGVVVALVLAVGIVHVRFLRSAIMPVALLLNVTPIVAIAPALIVAFGFSRTPHVIVVTLCVFFPMLINATAGLRAIDPLAAEVFGSMSATKRDVLFRLRIPASLPYLFAGLRTSASMAMLGAIISEFTGTNLGLGATIATATFFLNLSQMWAAILIAALTSIALLGVVALAERLTIRW